MSEKLKVLGGAQAPPCHCDRQGGTAKAVQIGGHTIWAGGGMYLTSDDLSSFRLHVDLRAEGLPKGIPFGRVDTGILWLPIHDFQVVGDQNWDVWKQRLDEVYQKVMPTHKVVVYCAGGHGRTGLFLASMLAMVESNIDDPVAEIRRRYCPRAVETAAQHAQVMRLLKETRRCTAATTS